MEILILLSLMFLDDVMIPINCDLLCKPQLEVTYLTELNTSSLLTSIIDSLPNKKWINILRAKSPQNFLPEPFTVNRQCDTIIVKPSNWSLRIFSARDNIFLQKKEDYVEDTRYYQRRNSKYDYYDELLLKWDIDSLEILCLYDDNEYEVTPSDTVFRFLIRNGEIIGHDSHIFHATPAKPDNDVFYNEKIRRLEIRRSLQSHDPEMYQRLFMRKKNNLFLDKTKNWFAKKVRMIRSADQNQE